MSLIRRWFAMRAYQRAARRYDAALAAYASSDDDVAMYDAAQVALALYIDASVRVIYA